MRKFELYRAIDKLDGDLSYFIILSDNCVDIGYSVLDWSIYNSDDEAVADQKRKSRVYWSEDNDVPRRDYMINPTLLAEWDDPNSTNC